MLESTSYCFFLFADTWFLRQVTSFQHHTASLQASRTQFTLHRVVPTEMIGTEFESRPLLQYMLFARLFRFYSLQIFSFWIWKKYGSLELIRSHVFVFLCKFVIDSSFNVRSQTKNKIWCFLSCYVTFQYFNLLLQRWTVIIVTVAMLAKSMTILPTSVHVNVAWLLMPCYVLRPNNLYILTAPHFLQKNKWTIARKPDTNAWGSLPRNRRVTPLFVWKVGIRPGRVGPREILLQAKKHGSRQ